MNSDDILELLGNTLIGVKVRKIAIGWSLQEIEKAVKDALQGERESDSDDETTDDDSDAA